MDQQKKGLQTDYITNKGLSEGKRICYLDGKFRRLGTIIELDRVGQRCRIRWEDGSPRTFIRASALGLVKGSEVPPH